MRIDEIIKTGPISSSRIDTLRGDGVHIMDVCGFPVFLYKIGKQHAYIVKDGTDTVSSLVFNLYQYKGKEAYICTRAFTEPKYRGKGIAVTLLLDVKKFTDNTIISDEELTDDGLKMWEKLAQMVNVNIINLDDSREVIPYKGNESLIIQQKGKPRYSFIMENA